VHERPGHAVPESALAQRPIVGHAVLMPREQDFSDHSALPTSLNLSQFVGGQNGQNTGQTPPF
jgi:hypothetical protein